MDNNTLPIVSVILLAYNEEKFIEQTLNDVLAQDYPLTNIELVLVDSASTDSTQEKFKKFQEKYQEKFSQVLVVDNPKRTQPAGWNVAFPLTTGEIITRIDAHASFPPDFISAIVAVLNEGEYVCGGPRPVIMENPADPIQEVLFLAEQSALGVSVAQYRRDCPTATYVNAVFHGAYRREALAKAMPFDERLVRTEDNCLYDKLRKAGYKVRFDPRIRSQQVVRSTLKGMIRQKYLNGFYIGRTLLIQPSAIGKHHLIPGVFVSTLGAAGILALAKHSLLLKLIGGSYLLGITAMTAQTLIARTPSSEHPNYYLPFLPTVFPLIHLSYGVGTIKGLLHGIWHREYRSPHLASEE